MQKVTINRMFGALLVTAVATAPMSALAHDPAGMMGGYGMGCDMMGSGMGMMSGGGYGAGMMGPGMMGGYGMGMPFAGPLAMLDLTDEQRTQLDKIQATLREQHRSVMVKMFDAQDKLRGLYAVESPDPKQVGAAYAAISALQQQMIEAHVQANNDTQAVLTKEQREQLQTWRQGRPYMGGMMRR